MYYHVVYNEQNMNDDDIKFLFQILKGLHTAAGSGSQSGHTDKNNQSLFTGIPRESIFVWEGNREEMENGIPILLREREFSYRTFS